MAGRHHTGAPWRSSENPGRLATSGRRGGSWGWVTLFPGGVLANWRRVWHCVGRLQETPLGSEWGRVGAWQEGTGLAPRVAGGGWGHGVLTGWTGSLCHLEIRALPEDWDEGTKTGLRSCLL